MVRPPTLPETPIPKAIEREKRLVEAETDIEWIKQALLRIEEQHHACVQDATIAGLVTWRKVVGGILSALALCMLGAFGAILATCQAEGHAGGVVETRLDDHSRRVTLVEQNIAMAEQARQSDTVRILAAIREKQIESETRAP